MNIRSAELFGYSELDWEYAKKKADDPKITFEEVLKEKLEEKHMFYSSTTTRVYGEGTQVKVSTNPQQKWELVKKVGTMVVLEHAGAVLQIPEKDLDRDWRAV